MQSNFGNFQYVDDYQLILDYANDLLQESTYADQSAIKIKTKEALENLSQANTDAARRAALKSFLEFLQNEYQIKIQLRLIISVVQIITRNSYMNYIIRLAMFIIP